MNVSLPNRHANTEVPIHAPLAARWSPRSFDPESSLTTGQLTAMLEAARWAATWRGRQPVRFVVGLRDDESFIKLRDLLSRGNDYAHTAGALILLCADEGEDDSSARYAAVDVGSAMANLSIEAVARGLIVHPMAGFDIEGARAAFEMPAGIRPFMVIAVGSLGDYRQMSAEIIDRDSKPRTRRPLREVAFSGRWGQGALV